jgi:hypothetical protein
MFHANLAKKITPKYDSVIALTSKNESVLVIYATRPTEFGQQNFL